jgi:hypothetical protein
MLRTIFCLLVMLSGSTHVLGATTSVFTVVVSIQDQRTAVFQDGVLIRTMVCSTGIPGTDNATPTGDFVINESGKKRGPWFYSNEFQEGAKYWVGFVGGTYLFHSVPMDKAGKIISSEAAKLGTTASHGCVRLSVDDARWFYSTIPDGTPVHILAGGLAGNTSPDGVAVERSQISGWLDAHGATYRQKYTLSCEIALTRLSLALMGITDVTEDQILATIPRKGSDPETAFVCDAINGGRKNQDGTIHWNNYGTHPPVVVGELQRRLTAAGIGDRFVVQEGKADDAALRAMITGNPRFLGAIVWVIGHPSRWGPHTVNDRGMVLGEHVRFVQPVLSNQGQFRIYDPETGTSFLSSDAGAGRELFSNRVVGIFTR